MTDEQGEVETVYESMARQAHIYPYGDPRNHPYYMVCAVCGRPQMGLCIHTKAEAIAAGVE